MSGSALSNKALELRRAFDRAFATPPPAHDEQREDLVTVRVSGRLYALRALDMSGLFQQTNLLKLPARQYGLRGVAKIRGALVPVYDLGLLLEHGSCSRVSPWIAVCSELGFSFENLEGFVRVGTHSVRVAELDAESGVASRVLSTSGELQPIIDLRALAERLKGPGPDSVPGEKR